MTYIRVPLKNTISINRIVTVYYHEFSPKYKTRGESHDFWEIVYVDRGEIDLRGGDLVHHMREGEVIFHQPDEFHSVAVTVFTRRRFLSSPLTAGPRR